MDADFHFHEWAFLARTDAQAFERRRLRLLEAFLSESGQRRPGLELLQREIDRQRASAANPQAAVAAISGMMCNSFCTLIGELRELRCEIAKLDRLSSAVGASDAGEGSCSAASPGNPDAIGQVHDVVLTGR